MKEKEYTREERLEMEEHALQTLLQYGITFSVPLKIEPKSPPKWLNLWNKHFPHYTKVWMDKRIPKDWDVEIAEIPDINLGVSKSVYMRNFCIKPLYLGTIDLIRMQSIEIEYNEAKVQEDPLKESERLMKYVPHMCKIIAIATLNCCEASDLKSRKVKELQKFFIDHLTSARLQKLCSIIDKMSDKAGFTNSIRLMFKAGTTSPKANRVE